MNEQRDNNRSKLILLSGPSGSGKTTIMHSLTNKYNIVPLSYYTTRSQRNDDIVSLFHYISLNEYINMYNNGNFALSFGNHNNRYGVSYDELNSNVAERRDMILAISYKNYFDILNKDINNIVDIHLIILTFNNIENMVRKRLLERNPNIDKEYLDMKILYAIKENQEYFDLIKPYANCIINTDEVTIDETESLVYNAVYGEQNPILRRLK